MGLSRRTGDELAADIAALEAALEEASARLQDAEDRAVALAEEKVEVEGRAKLARQAVADFELRILQQRKALAAAHEYEDACRALDAVVEQRDAAAGRLATAARELIASFDELTRLRSELETADDELRRRFAESARDIPHVPGEPPELDDAWNALRKRLQEEIEKNLDEELLEAAANSPFPRDVEKLPAHLQIAGRRRWMERRRGQSDRDRDDIDTTPAPAKRDT